MEIVTVKGQHFETNLTKEELDMFFTTYNSGINRLMVTIKVNGKHIPIFVSEIDEQKTKELYERPTLVP